MPVPTRPSGPLGRPTRCGRDSLVGMFATVGGWIWLLEYGSWRNMTSIKCFTVPMISGAKCS